MLLILGHCVYIAVVGKALWRMVLATMMCACVLQWCSGCAGIEALLLPKNAAVTRRSHRETAKLCTAWEINSCCGIWGKGHFAFWSPNSAGRQTTIAHQKMRVLQHWCSLSVYDKLPMCVCICNCTTKNVKLWIHCTWKKTVIWYKWML